MPYGLKPLEDIVELCIISCWIKPKPVSLGIFAPPEYGKTETLLQYAGCEGVRIISDATPYGISSHILPEIASGRVRCIIIADLAKILNRGWRISNEVLSLLNVLIEEGVGGIYTPTIRFDPYSSGIIDLNKGKRVRCGCIIAAPIGLIEARKETLTKYGFWSRILPFYYEYTEEDLLRAHEAIKEGKNPFKPKKIDLPKEDVEIILPKEEADKLDPIVNALRVLTGSETGFRLRWNLQQLSKAHAWKMGRDVVEEEDIRAVVSYAPFIHNPITGDECMYRILRALPARSEEIVKELSGMYSRATIYRRLKKLKEMGIIRETIKGYDIVLY